MTARLKPPEHAFSILLALVLLTFVAAGLISSWPTEKSSGTAVLPGPAKPGPGSDATLAARGFSAVQVAANAYTSSNSSDFLTMYLDQDLPYSITDSDLELLRQTGEQLIHLPDIPSNHYKAGMCFFFLATAETVAIASEKPAAGPAVITGYWKQAAGQFHKARDLGQPMASYIDVIISEADQDRNGQLNLQELVSIVASHLYGEAK